MNMPSFTSEASLYQTSNRYRSAVGGSFLSGGNATVAGGADQLGLAQLPLAAPLPKGCGPCGPDPDGTSPTGCSKACNINGELVQVNCTCPPPPTVCGP